MKRLWDGHAHVFAPDLNFVSPRRYTPAYVASVEQYLALLDAHGLDAGLLTQPSFLGTDNSHMLAAVAKAPERLRAVVVVDPAIDDRALDTLGAQGAVGVRLNLEGRELPDLRAGSWPGLFERVRSRNWHVEFHRRAGDLPGLVEPLIEAGLRVCVDHFGRPDPALGAADPGFRSLLGMASSGQVWVKVSAAYRTGGVQRGEALAPTLLAELLAAFGSARLIWASDWPHTQYESLVSYGSCFDALSSWLQGRALEADLRSAGMTSLIDGV